MTHIIAGNVANHGNTTRTVTDDVAGRHVEIVFGGLNLSDGGTVPWWHMQSHSLLPYGNRSIGACNNAVQSIFTSNLNIGGQVAATQPWVESVLRTWDTLPGKPQWVSEIGYSNVGWAISPGVLQNFDIILSNSLTPISDDSFDVGQHRLKYRNVFTNRVVTGNVMSVIEYMYFGRLNAETGASELYWKSDAAGITPINARDLGSSAAWVNKVHASNVDIAGEKAATQTWVNNNLPAWLSEITLSNIGPFTSPSACNNDDLVTTQSISPNTSGSINIGHHLLPFRNCFANRVVTGSCVSIGNNLFLGAIDGTTGQTNQYWVSNSSGLTPVGTRSIGSAASNVSATFTSDLTIGNIGHGE